MYGRVCFNEVRFFEYGLYMFCVACMRFAHGFAVQFAIALLLMSRNKKLQEKVRMCILTSCHVSNMDCICVV